MKIKILLPTLLMLTACSAAQAAEVAISYSTMYMKSNEVKTHEKSCLIQKNAEHRLFIEQTNFVVAIELNHDDTAVDLRVYTRPQSRSYNQIVWMSSLQLTEQNHIFNFGNATDFNSEGNINDFDLSIGKVSADEAKELNPCQDNFFELTK